jgi:hypothetical protein
MHIFFIFYLNFCYKKIFKKLFLKKKKTLLMSGAREACELRYQVINMST